MVKKSFGAADGMTIDKASPAMGRSAKPIVVQNLPIQPPRLPA
jgi:hypothetical protein